ncbi:MAG: pilin [Patescibacteria group bacterium]
MANLNPFSPDFQLSVCDGPKDLPGIDPNKICDFKGLMTQAQFLINAMIMLGVLAAIVSLSYGGYLYITGEEGKIKQAKEIFRKTGWGFVMMLTAWFIVFQLLDWLAGNEGVKTLLGK